MTRVFARTVPWGRPAQPSVPVLGPRGIGRCIPPVPDRGFRKPAAAIRDRRPVKAPPPRARPVSSLPRSYDRSPLVPLYSNSGMKRDYGLPEELHPRCRAAPVDYGRAPPDRRMPYRDDYPPPPEESAYKKMEEELIMSHSRDKEFVLFAPPPRMVNGRWIHYPAIAYPNEEREFKFRREESPCEALPAEESGVKGTELCDWEPCGICGGKHDWCSCPLRWACPFDQKVGKDFEVVCRCSVWNCTQRCTYPIGMAVFKNPLPFIF
ncbi:hypothetical protein CASFOL_011259 [Castilleja foliolosa]|uniref:Uncharacterized protein n=1 Tax=Castilleja foliolosa TaxID=1961234 RepID=A0ABD3DVZ8_9LAMI